MATPPVLLMKTKNPEPCCVRFRTIEVGNINKMEREDGGFPLPINDKNNYYTWIPINTGKRLQVMTDFTFACQKGCRTIWCTTSTDNTLTTPPNKCSTGFAHTMHGLRGIGTI
jgi:hypothetical protein